MAPSPPAPHVHPGRARIGRRSFVLLLVLAAGLVALAGLGLDPARLAPNQGGLDLARDFFARAVTPALTYEDPGVPDSAPPFLVAVARRTGRTVAFAAAAMSLALGLGVGLGFFASTAWWADETAGRRSGLGAWARRALAPSVYVLTRALIALMRSIHELFWALIFLIALGKSDVLAAIAISLPFAGTLAKIFSEMIDEAPRDAAHALRGAGASPLQTFFFALVPRALPDLGAYAFYRFECALRASAVLGFFGYETIGLALSQSFENLHYGEVWTYLYALVALIAITEWWSGAIRRRLVA